MFLIDVIKPKVEKKLKLVLLFARLFRGGELEAHNIKPHFVPFRFRFAGGDKNFIQKKRKNIF